MNNKCKWIVAFRKEELEAGDKIDDKGNSEEYYQAQVTCRNCGKSMLLWFNKGLSIYKHRCPNCECMYLNKK